MARLIEVAAILEGEFDRVNVSVTGVLSGVDAETGRRSRRQRQQGRIIRVGCDCLADLRVRRSVIVLKRDGVGIALDRGRCQRDDNRAIRGDGRAAGAAHTGVAASFIGEIRREKGTGSYVARGQSAG